MLISFWSNMHGQGATSAATAAFASFIAQKTAYKTLVAHNHIERSALEGYFFKPSGQAGLDLTGLANHGLDALIRLMRNGRLRPYMIPDYAYSFLKNNRLDILTGTEKKEALNQEDWELFMSILDLSRKFYDLVILDLHSGLSTGCSRELLERSDIVVFCVNQNRLLLDDLNRCFERFPFLKEKKSAYIISRYEKASSMTKGNLARRYGINKNIIFEIPESPTFMDALNTGRVFDFVAYYRNAAKSEKRAFIDSLDRLSDYLIKGWTE
ncbi:MAG: hypothetical protein GXX10_06905 [Clostridiaceae bacterium]|nr:hypothetical protein [Clostridiaceae bacterium]